MLRRSLLAIGTAHYGDEAFDDLARVPEAVRTMAATFAGLGFETAELLDPTKADCEDAVEAWLHSGWSPQDVAVLYVTGHGISAAAGHYLAMADSVAGRDAKAAVETRFVSTALGDDPELGQLLVLLDTCYSEGGSDALVGAASTMKLQWPQGDRQYWVVSSARARQEAQQLVFAAAFSRALTELRASFGSHSPTIPLTSVVGRTNLLLGRPPYSVAHRATVTPLVPAPGDDGFFDNPEYAATPVTVLAPEVVPASELRSHWIPRALGGTNEVGTSLFRGRTEQLGQIEAWATDPDQPGLLVVTGAPGTGKSALLAQFVVPGVGDGSRPRAARAVHARGLTAGAVRNRVADLFDDGAGQLVVIDALDEATDPEVLETFVVAPLVAAGARVAVGVRPALAHSWAAERVTVDLDKSPDRLALRSYAAEILSSAEGSPYAAGPTSVGEVAAAVAGLAGDSFLLAGLIARTLVRMERPLAPEAVADARQSFGSIAGAFERDLARIGDDTGLVRELLTALAWSQGGGLPWEGVWPAVAGALFAPRTYADSDVRRALDAAADYVVEASLDGHSYFRLYHELFAEHLRKGYDEKATHEVITRSLMDLTPTDTQGRLDWASAHPYVCRSLAEHAARGGLLEDLLEDPRLPLALDTDRLAVALNSRLSLGPNAAAVQRCLEQLREGGTQLPSQLALAAMQTGATGLASRARAQGFGGTTWWPLWVRWASIPAHAVVARVTGKVVGIATVEQDGETLVVAASADGEVACHALSSGRQLWRRDLPEVSSLAAAGDVVAVATRDTVHILRSSDGTDAALLPGPAAGGHSTTSALAVHSNGDETLVAAGTYNEWDDDDDDNIWSGLLRLWRLSNPTTVAWVVPAFGTGVRTLDFLVHERGLRLVAGGDPFTEPKASGAVARVFDVATGRVLHESPPDLASYADAVVRGDGTVLMVLPNSAGGTSNPVIRWAPESGELVVRSLADQQTSGAMALAADESTLLVGSYTDLVVVSPDTLESIGGWTNGIAASVVATTRYAGRLLVLTGSWSGEVKLWDLAAVSSPVTAKRRPRIVCATCAGDDLVAYSVDDGTGALETARLDDGVVLARNEQVFASAMTATPDGRLLVNDAGNVRQLDPFRLAPRGDNLALHTGRINALSMAGDLLLTCGTDAAVQVSDLDSGPVCPPLLHADYKMRPLEVVRRVQVAGTPEVVALDYNAELVFWDWSEALAGKPNGKDGSNSAHRSVVDARHSGGRCFAVWQAPKGTVFLRPDAVGGVEATLMPGRRSAQWSLQATPLHLLEMLGPDLLLTGDHTGTLRGWLLPERRLVAQAAFGASLTTLVPIGDDRVLVGTDAGLVLLQVNVR
ncbi:caspase family protein [Ornithinimicrobium pekingense]|uniref:Peptidase C14 caspase domain-containing protein n=1 Tax=Ornithinimicrobium pekingense TaxID=384677 RepID=A0ABQ2F4E0_9MICO|nr:caspase family protein [Ornithinimicrobium pekingense]GGK60949.1 hypothetical protein GCM10011509_06560 [Ornithinimicrobium pekingense]